MKFFQYSKKRLTLELYNAINQTDYDNPGTGVAKGRTLGADQLASLISAMVQGGADQEAIASSVGVMATEVNSSPPAGCTVSNLFREMSSQIGIPAGIANGHTPPGRSPVIRSTSSRGIICGFS